jgi:hypothetical protein
MGKNKITSKAAPGWALFLRKAWLDVVLLALAAVTIGAGFYLHARPDWTLREDIRNLNEGVTAFNAPPGLLPPSPALGRPAEYPIERAGALWEKAAAISTDNNIKSLAFYNYGTLIGREAWAQALPGPGHAQVDMTEGIRKLGEALRADPSNEDAKYNLELMEKVAQVQGEKEGGPGDGYSPGAVEKGY